MISSSNKPLDLYTEVARQIPLSHPYRETTATPSRKSKSIRTHYHLPFQMCINYYPSALCAELSPFAGDEHNAKAVRECNGMHVRTLYQPLPTKLDEYMWKPGSRPPVYPAISPLQPCCIYDYEAMIQNPDYSPFNGDRKSSWDEFRPSLLRRQTSIVGSSSGDGH
jgi:hypothetical protein